MSRPSTRFVPIKTLKQQAETVIHKTRELLLKQRTMTTNSLRGLMAEFGIVVPEGPCHNHISKFLLTLADQEGTRIPDVAQPP